MIHTTRLEIILLCTGCVLFASACERNGASTETDPDAPITSVRNDPESLWNSLNGESFVLNLDDVDAALQQAIEAARASAGSAQQRWSAQDDADHERWMICWAAHVDDERVEYLWVMPFTWSAHRVEGMLLNEPLEPTPRDWHRGDLVFFPADELADWVYLPAGNAKREGGTVLTLIEQQYGSPGT
jgi:uncharacterized protein YegJ (DUF2314 family)